MLTFVRCRTPFRPIPSHPIPFRPIPSRPVWSHLRGFGLLVDRAKQTSLAESGQSKALIVLDAQTWEEKAVIPLDIGRRFFRVKGEDQPLPAIGKEVRVLFCSFLRGVCSSCFVLICQGFRDSYLHLETSSS